jgi:hypothetical protein
MKCLFTLSLFVLLIAVTPCMAKIKEYPLDKMVDRSKLIVLGIVVRIMEPSRAKGAKDTPYGEAVAIIEIEQIIIGSYEKKQVDVTYYPRLSEGAHFEIGERCILFLDERNALVQSYAGKILIEGERAEVLYILGEQVRQDLKDFIQRIKDRGVKRVRSQGPE